LLSELPWNPRGYLRLWNHATAEHLVHHGSGDLIEKYLMRLRIIVSQANQALHCRARLLATVGPELKARVTDESF
jgi:hypothetical protein